MKQRTMFIFKQIFLVIILASLALTFVSCKTKDLVTGDDLDIVEPTTILDELGNPSDDIPNVNEWDLLGTVNETNLTGTINLSNDNTSSNTSNVKITKSDIYGVIVEITKSGTYVINGTLTNGFISISKKELEVTIILNGVNIYSPHYSALVCLKKSNVSIVLSSGSTNYLTDSKTYNMEYDDEEEPNATLLIRKDLSISGSGKLIINGNSNNGIGSRANLTIDNAKLEVSAVNNAVKGNDSITISNSNINIKSLSDGIKSEGTLDDSGVVTEGGEIVIIDSTIQISSTNDGIQAASALTITNNTLTIKTGNGRTNNTSNESSKGLKSRSLMIINSGTINIDSSDDSIHSNSAITIDGGTINLGSGDDGIHADTDIIINGGTINISKSYEGIESLNITINGGSINLISTDDGINISGGKDQSNTNTRPGGRPGFNPGGQAINGKLIITGGTIVVNAEGDGLDSNGSIEMSGGNVTIYGPKAGANGAIDYDGTFEITGGNLLALGNGSMDQSPKQGTQKYFLINLGTINPNVLLTVVDSNGKTLAEITTQKITKTLVYSSPTLVKGTYKIMSGSTLIKSVTVS